MPDISLPPLTPGDAFSLAGTVKLDAGDWKASASLRNAGGVLITKLPVQTGPMTDGEIIFGIRVLDTLNWQPGKVYLQFTAGQTTETLIFDLPTQ